MVDAVPVSALGLSLFDQDAGASGRAWGEGLSVSVDDGDAVLGFLFRFLHFGPLAAPITGRAVWDC